MPPSPSPAANYAVPTSARMKIDCSLSYEVGGDSEFIFMIQASHMSQQVPQQVIVSELLTLEPPLPFRTFTDGPVGNRFLRLQAPAGRLKVSYNAVVDRIIEVPNLAALEVPVHDIPDALLHYLMPTRYCESDHLGNAAQQMFGQLAPGYARVEAITQWVRSNIIYRLGSSNATTTARDIFVQRAGVCRDFAHLSITLCRALNIPARLVCGYVNFPDPPPDFHAIFEAYLGGRWVLFDPTGMAPVEHVVRVATGRDAKDVAFATIFGPARMTAMSPEVTWLDAPQATQQTLAPPAVAGAAVA